MKEKYPNTKTLKRFTAFLLALCLTLLSIPFSPSVSFAEAADGVYPVNIDKDSFISFIKEEGSLICDAPEGVSLECEKDEDTVFFTLKSFRDDDIFVEIDIGSYSSDVYVLSGARKETPSNAESASDAGHGPLTVSESIDTVLSFLLPSEFVFTYEDDEVYMEITVDNPDFIYSDLSLKAEREDEGFEEPVFLSDTEETLVYKMTVLEGEEEISVPASLLIRTDSALSGVYDYVDGSFVPADTAVFYNLDEDGFTFKTESLDMFALSVMPLAGIGDVLDGDYAYIEAAWTDGSGTGGYDITTGTAPWDDTEGAGDDTSAFDNTVRTFDTINYSITLATHMREDSDMSGYRSGKVYFEFIIDRPLKEAQFEPEAMPWIHSKDGSYTITEEEINGVASQVMRGYFILSVESEGSMAIGEGTSSVNLVVRPLAMVNGDEISPTAAFWLDFNDVGLDYSGYGTETGYDCTVTYNGKECEEHGEKEFAVITAPVVKISAVPSVRVALGSRAGESAQGEFDFNTGLETAVNYGIGKVYGRLVPCGACIQILPKADSKTSDLRGVEMPKYDGETEITFDIELTSSFSFDDSSEKPDTTEDYTPLLFSIEGNESKSTQSDGRDTSRAHTAFSSFPRNTGGDYCKCYNGGTWTAVQEGNILHITVTDYELSLDIGTIPYTNPTGNVNTHTYFNPDECENYWEIGTYCFSSGELFILQPYYTDYEDNEGYILDYNDVRHTGGSFSMTMKDGGSVSEMVISSNNEEGSVSAEMTSQNNSASLVVGYNAGSLGDNLYYIEYASSGNSTPLTEGCESTTEDWVLFGGKLSTCQRMLYSGAEGGNLAAATDSMTKFDPEFMTIESIRENKNTGILSYGGKVGGWESDQEMIEATADDLVFYSSLEDLEKDGYTCVAVLDEFRGTASSDRTHFIDAYVSENAEVGGVYLITQYARVWTISDLAQAMVDDENTEWANKDAAVEYLISLSEEEIQPFIDEYIPVRRDSKETLVYSKDYPAASFIDLGRDGNTSNTASMLSYTKCYYDEEGYHRSNHEGKNFADCCLLIGWDADVNIHTAQTGSGSSYVQYYDMDTGQYTVDYEADISLNRNLDEGVSASQEVYDTVYLSVTVPSEMTYIPGSSYISGEYTDNGVGKQGSVEGGTQLLSGQPSEYTYVYYNGNEKCEALITVTLTEEEAADGSVVLLYTLENVPVTGGNDGSQYLDPIHFSAQIDPMKVSNNDSLSVIAVVWTESDVRDASSYGSSEASIQINKQSTTSLIKRVDKTRAEAGSSLFYTVQFAVTSSNEFEVLLMDTLPFDGDGGSSFKGSVRIESFAVSADESVMDLSKFDVFYTTDKEEHATKSDEWEYGDFIEEDGSVNEEIYEKGWSLLSLTKTGSNTYEALSFPQEDVYAVAVVGKTSGRSEEGVLTQEMTLSAPSAEAGSVIVNTATQKYAFNGEVYDLTSSASTDIISRSVKGTVWLDEDMDGGMDTGTYSSEQRIEGVTVSAEVYDADTDTWEAAKDAYGNACEAVTDEEGCYELGDLYAGTYRLSFSNNGEDTYYLTNLKATVFEAEDLDSEKTSKLDEEDKMLYLYLPDSSSDVFGETPGYTLDSQNAGFTDTQDFTVQKAWRDAFGKDIADDMEEEVTVTVSVKDLGSFDVALSKENEWTQTVGLPYYDGEGGRLSLSEENITVTEEVPEGFTMTYQVHPDAERIVVLNRKDMYFDDVDILKTDEEGNPLKGAGFIVKIDYTSYPTYYATASSTSSDGTSSGYITISFDYGGRINGTDSYYGYVTDSSDMGYKRKVRIVVKSNENDDFYVSTAKDDFVGDYFYTMETELGTEDGFSAYYASTNIVSLTANVPAYFYRHSANGEEFTKYAVFDIDKGTNTYTLVNLVSNEKDATTITSGEDGYMRLEGLIPGTYTVTETGVPESYYYDEADTTFEVKENSHTEEVVIENKQHTFSVETDKTDEEGNPMEGVTFTLSKDEKEISSGLTDSDGKLVFEGLTAGTFVLTETEAPEEYQLKEPIEFTVEWDSEKGAYVSASEEYTIRDGVLKISVVNEKKRFDVSVFTYEEEDEERLPLSGAGYSLYSSSGTLMLDGLASDEEGFISLTDIPVGTYILFETQAPEGYLLPGTSVFVFTLSASGAVTVISETDFADVQENVINIKNEKIPSTPRLPDAGGAGTLPYIFSGTALMGFCLFVFRKRRRPEK